MIVEVVLKKSPDGQLAQSPEESLQEQTKSTTSSIGSYVALFIGETRRTRTPTMEHLE